MTKEEKRHMKRKILIIALALLLCLSLCACGNTRTSYNKDYGMTDKSGMNGSTERVPDVKDGYVGNNNADDGVIVDNLPSPSPNLTNKR